MVTLKFADGTEKQVDDSFMDYSDIEKVYYLTGMDRHPTNDPHVFLTAVKNQFGGAALRFPDPGQVVVWQNGREKLYHYSHATNGFVSFDRQ